MPDHESPGDRVDHNNLLSRKGDNLTSEDVVRMMLGYYDPVTGKFVSGLLSTVNDLTDSIKKMMEGLKRTSEDLATLQASVKQHDAHFAFANTVDRYVLRGIALVILTQFIGVGHLSDIMKFFHGG